MSYGRKFGVHRVISPPFALPQAADRLRADPVCEDDEILIDVDVLNIDSASFRQLQSACGDDAKTIAQAILRIVRERGKMHNPVTQSGGMLIGRVAEIGRELKESERFAELRVGDRVATLVSLTLTPLYLKAIHRVDLAHGQVFVTGQAVLFASGLYAKLPTDVPERVALALFDVCGAPALVGRVLDRGRDVVVLGAGGKAGLLALAEARRCGANRVVAVDLGQAAMQRIARLGAADVVLNVDATQPLAVLAALDAAGGEADVVVNCVNVPDTEMTSILCAKDGGIVLFFSMATRFSQAALGAEGVGKDVVLRIGSGYCLGHAEHTLALLRADRKLYDVFVESFGEEVSTRE
ncbi:MAG: zinc-binding dehydrogenase [Alicyclobacillus herbarius]|uniref:L-erythro-3,5-diaminohexanoate dehydrogenase n=1 Tax=Alicyclobacillus herbarius TaxID=122960 RepID=UPI002354AB3C|nr:zinc-binding dehydrogenase [Alicyclobacillus herbarius]MCL6631939.1 zinc-binding dehydrogenase [Alicyclobacillus herbarius]